MEYIYTEDNRREINTVYHNYTCDCGGYDPRISYSVYLQNKKDKIAEYNGCLIEYPFGKTEFRFETEQDKMFFLLKYS